MIVRYDSDQTLKLITQNDHARLSGLMAAHWGNAGFDRPEPYESNLRAAQFHDLGWVQYETCPTFDPNTRRTINFLDVPNDRNHLEAFRRSHEWLTSIDPYAGLLVTKHRTGVYQARYNVLRQPTPPKVREPIPDLKAYIAQSEAEQKPLLAAVDSRVFHTNFILLQIWDLLSLWICCNETPKEMVVEPVPNGYSDGAQVSMRCKPIGSNTIMFDPFPFDQPLLQLGVIYRQLPTTEFNDATSFYQAYIGASPQIETFTFLDGHSALR
jgi:hypothetical protein